MIHTPARPSIRAFLLQVRQQMHPLCCDRVIMRNFSIVPKALSIHLVSILVTRLHGQSLAPASSSSASLSTSANTTGSLGSYCSSQAGIQAAIQAASASPSSHVLNTTVPAGLVQQVAQVTCFLAFLHQSDPTSTGRRSHRSSACLFVRALLRREKVEKDTKHL